MKILIDAGHGGKDDGGGTNDVFKEKDINLKISLYQYDRLKRLGIDASLTRENDVYLPKNERIQKVLSSKADICISNHINSVSNNSVSGVETIHSIFDDKTLAEILLQEIVKEGMKKRRVFTRNHPMYKETDYYYMHRETGDIETVIVEYGFASNETDTMNIVNNWRLYAESVIRGLCRYIDHPYTSEQYTSLLGNSVASIDQMKEWAKQKGATERFINVADLYWKYGNMTGIRADVLYCQSANETNFGKYTGIVKESMNNFAGIKVKKPIGNNIEDHESFNTIEDGVRGHFNHIAAYVGIDPIGTPHDRYYVVMSIDWAGSIKTVEELGGKWAPDKDYGKYIVDNYLIQLINTEVDSNSYEELYEMCIVEKNKLNEKIEYLLDKLERIKNEVIDVDK